MGVFRDAYQALEKAFFGTITRKLVGNFSFLVVVNGLSVAVFWSAERAVVAILARGQVDAATVRAIESTLAGHAAAAAAIYLFGVASTVAIVLFLRFLVVRPIRGIADLLQEIADGQGDLSRDLPAVTFDEIRTLSESYNRFVDRLREIIRAIRKMGVRVAVESVQVTRNVETSARLAGSQEELAGAVVDASAEATRAIEEAAVNVQEVAGSTSRHLETARTSAGELEEVSGLVGQIGAKLGQFRQTVERLDQTSRGIQGLLDLIQDISDQTNLLALNAAIEAARAGDAGRGFAVVAEEVRKLADRVRSATTEISTSVHDMVREMGSVQAESARLGDDAQHARETTVRTSAHFRDMVEDLGQTASRLGQVATAMEQLSATNRDVHDRVTGIRTLGIDVAGHLEKCRRSTGDLTGITEAIQELVSRFQIGHGAFDEVIRRARLHRDVVRAKIEALAAGGVPAFDDRYVPIPGNDPPKYRTGFTDAFASALQPLYDEALGTIPGATFVLAVDRNGYAPTHNGKYSRPSTGDRQVDLVQSRDRRLFADPTGIKAARSEAPILLQTYARDTGEILSDLSLPIRVGGRHWGALRVGVAPDMLLEE